MWTTTGTATESTLSSFTSAAIELPWSGTYGLWAEVAA